MAFIYQYELIGGGNENFNLYDNEETIESIIREIFGGRVKETVIV